MSKLKNSNRLRPKQEIDDKFVQAYKEWKAGKLTSIAAMQQIGMKKPTFYRRVKEHEGNGV